MILRNTIEYFREYFESTIFKSQMILATDILVSSTIHSTTQSFSQYMIDLGESGRWIYLSIEALLFYLLIFLAFYSRYSHDTIERETKTRAYKRLQKIGLSKFTFLAFLSAFVFISRVPLAVYGIENPDESLWIAAAKTLLHDPRYWISVDGGTGGPLIAFSPIFLKVFGLPIDFGSLKILGTIIMLMSTCFLFLALTKEFGLVFGRLMILPFAVAVSTMKQSEMIAYNSEHMVILLLSAALYFLSRLNQSGAGKYYFNLIVLGLLLGSVPFAKLQGAPMAFCVGIFACLLVYWKLPLRLLTPLVISALIPLSITVLLVLSYSGLPDFWQSYIINNLIYTGDATIQGFGAKMDLFIHLLYQPNELTYFIDYSCVIILLGSFMIISLRKGLSKRDIGLLLFSIIFLIVSVYCIVAPGRSFTHYILLFFIPLSVLTAMIIYCVCNVFVFHFNESIRLVKIPVVLIFLVVTVLYQFQNQFSYHPSWLEKANSNYNGYVLHANAVQTLNGYYYPGAKMAIWGWGTELWAETNFLMGTRYGNTDVIIKPGPVQKLHTDRFLADMEKNKPLLFVDAVTPDFFRYTNRATDGFENFPKVKNYIIEHYHFDKEIDGVTIYVRK